MEKIKQIANKYILGTKVGRILLIGVLMANLVVTIFAFMVLALVLQ